MATGTITKLTDRGYGFIKADGQENDIFFHATELASGDFNSLQEGDAVEFDIGENEKGPFASNISPASASASSDDAAASDSESEEPAEE